MSWFKRWIGIYVNFAVALLAPVILFYLIVVLPIYIIPDSTDDGDNSNDSNTFFENVASGELFLFVGLFSYSATIVIYFLYRNALVNANEQIEDLNKSREILKKLANSIPLADSDDGLQDQEGEEE